MRQKRGRRNKLGKLILMIVCIALMGVLATRVYLDWRGHGKVIMASNTFTESSRELSNSGRGFYHMQGFRITEEVMDFKQEISRRYEQDKDTNLTLIQINLQNFRDGAISEQGLANIAALFEALKAVDKQLIVRFLYDWNGKNMEQEPESLEVILNHMQQLEPVLRKYSDQIFLMQGLFIGNWGEMNGTRYLETEDMQKLAVQLASVTEDSTYLSVRMPAQWRRITQCGDPEQIIQLGNMDDMVEKSLIQSVDMKAIAWQQELTNEDMINLVSRLGLYNDGMLGSWSDYGTYGNRTREEYGDFTYWTREEELAFQEELCCFVPNGGEVIVDNSYNDFDNAVADMKQMHVTYLNRDYDAKVLDKWADTIVEEEGCFQGTDGLTYVERHLGYRLVLKESTFSYDFWKDELTVEASVQNVGFAPLYRETDVTMILYNIKDGSYISYDVEQDIRSLPGGTQEKQILKLSGDFELAGLMPGEYKVYLEVRDALSGECILFGNEQDPSALGYCLGEMKLLPEDTFFEAMEELINSYLSEVWSGENEWVEGTK